MKKDKIFYIKKCNKNKRTIENLLFRTQYISVKTIYNSIFLTFLYLRYYLNCFRYLFRGLSLTLWPAFTGRLEGSLKTVIKPTPLHHVKAFLFVCDGQYSYMPFLSSTYLQRELRLLPVQLFQDFMVRFNALSHTSTPYSAVGCITPLSITF